jgi:hypothetical protein
MNVLEKLQVLHNDLMSLKSKLDSTSTESEARDILKLTNNIAARCGAAYGQYTYLFEACGQKLHEIINDFFDRVEKKGEYADEE